MKRRMVIVMMIGVGILFAYPAYGVDKYVTDDYDKRPGVWMQASYNNWNITNATDDASDGLWYGTSFDSGIISLEVFNKQGGAYTLIPDTYIGFELSLPYNGGSVWGDGIWDVASPDFVKAGYYEEVESGYNLAAYAVKYVGPAITPDGYSKDIANVGMGYGTPILDITMASYSLSSGFTVDPTTGTQDVVNGFAQNSGQVDRGWVGGNPPGVPEPSSVAVSILASAALAGWKRIRKLFRHS